MFNITGVPTMITLTQTSSVNVTSGQAVCPSILVEFTCIGIDVSFLEWQINGAELQPNFDIGDSAPMEAPSGPYTLYLDAISVNNVDRVANMTIRFHANISNLNSGDQLSCATRFVAIMSSVFDYAIRGIYMEESQCTTEIVMNIAGNFQGVKFPWIGTLQHF